MSKVAVVNILRTLASASISASYAVLGTPILGAARYICLTNNTDGDMLFSIDGTNDYFFVKSATNKPINIATDRDDQDGYFALPANTQFYVKQSSAHTTGAVYLEVIYGN